MHLWDVGGTQDWATTPNLIPSTPVTSHPMPPPHDANLTHGGLPCSAASQPPPCGNSPRFLCQAPHGAQSRKGQTWSRTDALGPQQHLSCLQSVQLRPSGHTRVPATGTIQAPLAHFTTQTCHPNTFPSTALQPPPHPAHVTVSHTLATQMDLTKTTLLQEAPPHEHMPRAWAPISLHCPELPQSPGTHFTARAAARKQVCPAVPHAPSERARPPIYGHTCPATHTNTTERRHSPRVCRHALHGGDRRHALLTLTLETQLSSAAHRLASQPGLTPKRKTDRSHKHSPAHGQTRDTHGTPAMQIFPS